MNNQERIMIRLEMIKNSGLKIKDMKKKYYDMLNERLSKR